MLGGVEAGFLAEPSVSLSHAATSNLLSSFSSTPPFPHLLLFLLLLAVLTPSSSSTFSLPDYNHTLLSKTRSGLAIFVCQQAPASSAPCSCLYK